MFKRKKLICKNIFFTCIILRWKHKYKCSFIVNKFRATVIRTVAHIWKHNKQFLKHNTIFLKHKSIPVKHNTKIIETQHKIIETQHKIIEGQHKITETQHKIVETQHKIIETQLKTIETQSPMQNWCAMYNYTTYNPII